MKKVKRKLLIGASALLFVGAMFVFSDVNASKSDPWDNVFDGNDCTGSGEYCYALEDE